VEKLWDKGRCDCARCCHRSQGSAIDKKFYDEHRTSRQYIAEHDDEVIDKYLNEGTLTLEEMRKSIRKIDAGAEDCAGTGRFRIQEQGHSAAATMLFVDYLPVTGTILQRPASISRITCAFFFQRERAFVQILVDDLVIVLGDVFDDLVAGCSRRTFLSIARP